MNNLKTKAQTVRVDDFYRPEEEKILKMKSCPHCGHDIRPRKETLSKGLVVTLRKLVAAVKYHDKNDIDLASEIDLNFNERANFQKLRYHGLVHKVKGNSGRWLITRLGGQFLRNEVAVPKQIYVEENRIIGKGTTMVHVSEFYQAENWPEDFWQKDFDYDKYTQQKLI